MALAPLSLPDFYKDDALKATITGAGLTAEEAVALAPYAGIAQDFSDISRAKIIVLLEAARPTPGLALSLGPYPTTGCKEWFTERFASVADVLIPGVEAGVVVCLNMTPFGILEPHPCSTSTLKKLKSYAGKLGKTGSHHPGHIQLFKWLNHLQQHKKPLFLMACGTAYWRNTAFYTAAIAHGNAIQRTSKNNQGWRLSEAFYARADLDKIRDVATAALAEVQGADLPAVRAPAGVSAAFWATPAAAVVSTAVVGGTAAGGAAGTSAAAASQAAAAAAAVTAIPTAGGDTSSSRVTRAAAGQAAAVAGQGPAAPAAAAQGAAATASQEAAAAAPQATAAAQDAAAAAAQGAAAAAAQGTAAAAAQGTAAAAGQGGAAAAAQGAAAAAAQAAAAAAKAAVAAAQSAAAAARAAATAAGATSGAAAEAAAGSLAARGATPATPATPPPAAAAAAQGVAAAAAAGAAVGATAEVAPEVAAAGPTATTALGAAAAGQAPQQGVSIITNQTNSGLELRNTTPPTACINPDPRQKLAGAAFAATATRTEVAVKTEETDVGNEINSNKRRAIPGLVRKERTGEPTLTGPSPKRVKMGVGEQPVANQA